MTGSCPKGPAALEYGSFKASRALQRLCAEDLVNRI